MKKDFEADKKDAELKVTPENDPVVIKRDQSPGPEIKSSVLAKQKSEQKEESSPTNADDESQDTEAPKSSKKKEKDKSKQAKKDDDVEKEGQVKEIGPSCFERTKTSI